MNKRLQLKIIIKKCEQKFGRGSSENWKHNDYIDFSKLIFEKTKTSISHNTLKRIFGKLATDEFYLPQQATVDALIEYSDFDVNESISEVLDPEVSVVEEKEFAFKSSTKRKCIAFLAVIILSISVIAYWIYKSSGFNGNEINLRLTSFEGKLPKTCFFDVNSTNIPDSIFIDFGDRSSLVHLEPNQKSVSHTYFLPGVFDVNITNRVKKSIKAKVYVDTNKKWYALGFQRQRLIPKNYYAFLATKNQDSLFYVPNKELQKQGIDTIQPFFIRVCNYSPIKHSADSFVFETTFKKDTKDNGIVCNGLVFKISGSDNYIRFNFVNSGCSSRIQNVISDKTIDGVTQNLSPFVINFEKWNTIRLINQNKKLTLFVNDSKIYETTYNVSLGELRGLFLEFERNGFIKKCELRSLEGEIHYSF